MNIRHQHLKDQLEARTVDGMKKLLASRGCNDITTEFEFDENGDITKKKFSGKNKHGQDFMFCISIEPISPWDDEDDTEEWKDENNDEEWKQL